MLQVTALAAVAFAADDEEPLVFQILCAFLQIT